MNWYLSSANSLLTLWSWDFVVSGWFSRSDKPFLTSDECSHLELRSVGVEGSHCFPRDAKLGGGLDLNSINKMI